MGNNKWAALTPALFPNLDPIWMIRETAEQFGVPLRPYGMNEGYKGWVDIKIHKLIDEIGKVMSEGVTHVVYTDGRDVFYLAQFEEIVKKYKEVYGAPKMLQSSEAGIFESYATYYDLSLYPTPEKMGHPYTWPGSCAFMGEAQWIYEQLVWMKENYKFGVGIENSMPDDDPAWWRRWDSEHKELLENGTVKFDYGCEIFQNCGNNIGGGGQFEVALEVKNGRVYNRLTNSWPCVLHFNGGASDALKGKYGDIRPIWTALGHKDSPPWSKQ